MSSAPNRICILNSLFKILELLGFKNADKYHHLSYGMIRLPSGKIKSREGLVKGTGADDLMAELEDLARAEIKKRDDAINDKELAERAEQIALAALKFYILAVKSENHDGFRSPAINCLQRPDRAVSAVRLCPHQQHL